MATMSPRLGKKPTSSAKSIGAVEAPDRLYVRIAGRHATAREVLARAQAALEALGIRCERPTESLADDYAQIDPMLVRTPAPPTERLLPPAPDTGYAGLSSAQRAAFVQWLHEPKAEAPPAFHRLLLAHMETALVEAVADEDVSALRALTGEVLGLDSPPWRKSEACARTLLLALRLANLPHAWEEWICRGAAHVATVGLALGQQALAGAPLSAEEALTVARLWKITENPPPVAVVALRLGTLGEALGAPPLAAALERAGERVQQPRPFRASHRDLRLAFAQPDLRPQLEPLLAELFALPQEKFAAVAVAEVAAAVESGKPADKWNLVLEFGDSRSEYFEFALHQAQKQPGYSILLDEQRHIVYRIVFRRSEIRRFWALWEYVQGWANTRVYLNGVEMEKWKVYPYSYYMSTK